MVFIFQESNVTGQMAAHHNKWSRDGPYVASASLLKSKNLLSVLAEPQRGGHLVLPTSGNIYGSPDGHRLHRICNWEFNARIL